jgi:excisionase family DNA binding protein
VPETRAYIQGAQTLDRNGEGATTRPVEREWLSYREAEVYSGLSRATLWKLEGARKIKAARIGRAVRLSRRSIQEYMEGLADAE